MISALRSLLERRAQPLPDHIRRPVLGLTTVGLIAAVLWAWRTADFAVSDLRWGPVIALALIAAPASLVLKAAEFIVAARIAGQSPTRRTAAETAVVSAAANLLPLPGALLVTVRALSEGGVSFGGAVAASAIPGLAWLGATGLVGGTAIVAEGAVLLGIAVIAAGAVALAGAASMFAATAPANGRIRLGAAVLVVEIAWLLTSGLRFVLAAAAIGLDLTFTQALVLSVAGAASVAIGFVPGGLGVREALIAALSPLIGLDVDAGLILGVVDRVVWLAVLGVAALSLAAIQPSVRVGKENI